MRANLILRSFLFFRGELSCMGKIKKVIRDGLSCMGKIITDKRGLFHLPMFVFIALSLPPYGLVLHHGYKAVATKAGFNISNHNNTGMSYSPDRSCYVSVDLINCFLVCHRFSYQL